MPLAPLFGDKKKPLLKEKQKTDRRNEMRSENDENVKAGRNSQALAIISQ